VEQFGADADLTDFGAAETRFQLYVADKSVRLQHDIISASIDLTSEHLDVASAVSPHKDQQLAEEDMSQRLFTVSQKREYFKEPPETFDDFAS
jgi:hypothetical protein